MSFFRDLVSQRAAAPVGFALIASPAALGSALWILGPDASTALWLWSAVLAALLIALGAADLVDQRIPDALSAPLLALGLVFALVWPTTDLAAHSLAAFAGWLVGRAIDRIRPRRSGEPRFGEGDALILAGVGAWLGPTGLASAALLAAAFGAAQMLAMGVLALAWTRRRASVGSRPACGDRLAFAPALGAATWLVWLLGPLRLTV